MVWEERWGETKKKKVFRKERAGLGLVNLLSVVNLEGWGLLRQGIKTPWSKGTANCARFNCCSYLVLALVVMVSTMGPVGFLLSDTIGDELGSSSTLNLFLSILL